MIGKITRFPLFRDLSAADLKIISPLFSTQAYPLDAIIFEQGEPADCLYLLAEGEVQIRYKPYDGDPINLSRIKSGGVFGWSAVLGNAVYSSTAACSEDSEVLFVSGPELRHLLIAHPQTGRIVLDRLARAVSSRWVNAHAQIKKMLNNGIIHNDFPLDPEEALMTNNPEQIEKEAQIRALLEQLSAYIEQYHGGSVEMVSFDGQTLKVRLGGACLGCPLSPSTLHGWVEGTVRQFFPDVNVVEAVAAE
jgi:CRP/FNR family transcriptional regulator, cyclic AMP receptor protein